MICVWSMNGSVLMSICSGHFLSKKNYVDVDKPCEIQSFGKGGRRGKGHHMVLTSLFPGCKFLLEQIEVSGAQKVSDAKDVMNQHE